MQFAVCPTRLTSGICIVVAFLFAGCSDNKTAPIDYLGQQPPGKEATIFALNLFSTAKNEHSSPVFSPDGSRVLWSVMDSNYHGYLLEMTKVNGVWNEPHKPEFAHPVADDYYPSFSPDGKVLYFASRRRTDSSAPVTSGMRIWTTRIEGGKWTVPVPLDTLVSNGKDYAHSADADGTLFTSADHGLRSNLNIYRTRKVNGLYEQPKMLPFNINSVNYEDGPYIAPDGSFLIFESFRPESTDGSLDLFISFRRDQQWTMPMNMGPQINSPSSERFARLSPDGKYFFFGSSRPREGGGPGYDAYWIDASVITELKDKSAALNVIDETMGDSIIKALTDDNTETASVHLRRWLEKNPAHIDAVVLYLKSLRRQQKFSDAELFMKGLTADQQNHPQVGLESALLLFGSGRPADAHQLLEKNPATAEQDRERSLYLSGELLAMKQFVLSDTYFEKAMKNNPAMYPYINRARLLASMNENNKAIAALNKAVELGFSDYSFLESDPAFAGLKSEGGFRQLVARKR